jgi:hypothetical protein
MRGFDIRAGFTKDPGLSYRRGFLLKASVRRSSGLKHIGEKSILNWRRRNALDRALFHYGFP